MIPCGLATSSSQRLPSWLPKPRLSSVLTVVSGSKIRITIFSPNAVGIVESRISTSSPFGLRVLMGASRGRRRSSVRPPAPRPPTPPPRHAARPPPPPPPPHPPRGGQLVDRVHHAVDAE